MTDPADRGTSGAGQNNEPEAGDEKTVALTPTPRTAPAEPTKTKSQTTASAGDDATVALIAPAARAPLQSNRPTPARPNEPADADSKTVALSSPLSAPAGSPTRTSTTAEAAKPGENDRTVAIPAPTTRAPQAQVPEKAQTAVQPSTASDNKAMVSPPPAAKPADAPVRADKTVPHTVSQPPRPVPAPGAAPPPRTVSGSDDRTVVTRSGAALEEATQTIIAAPPQGRPRLVLRDAGGKQREFALVQPEVTVGRSSSCDVVVPGGTVSRLHAKVAQRAGEWALIPVGGHRNTYVNDELVTEPRLLHDGDRIQLGEERLAYRLSEGALSAPRAPRQLIVGALAALGVVAVAAAALYVHHERQATDQALVAQRAAQVAADNAAAAAAAAAGVQRQAELERQHQVELETQRTAELERQRAAEEERQRAATQAREREQLISKLLYQGDIAVVEHRYTTPTDGSAVYAYREVLKLDPSNQQALTQAAKILDDYLTWAERAVAARKLAEARVFAEKAAYVHEQIPAAGEAARVASRFDALQRALK